MIETQKETVFFTAVGVFTTFMDFYRGFVTLAAAGGSQISLVLDISSCHLDISQRSLDISDPHSSRVAIVRLRPLESCGSIVSH